MEWLIVVLGTVLWLLAATLTGIAWSAWRRFEDRRFLLVGITFLTISLAGFLSVVSETTGLWDEAFAVEPGPLLLLVLAVGTLYGAFLRPRGSAPGAGHG